MRLFLACALLLAACASSKVPDLDGNERDPLAGDLTVLIFVASRCPISNRYAPEIQRLAQAHSNLPFYLIYPDGSDEEARAHKREYGLSLPALRDPRRRLTRLAHAQVTPEAALFRGRSLVYHGRIDDRFLDFGRERAEPTEHDLARAIDAALAGREVTPDHAEAIGCAITE
jgi:thiol-disulfide isomerase/thioredoxin